MNYRQPQSDRPMRQNEWESDRRYPPHGNNKDEQKMGQGYNRGFNKFASDVMDDGAGPVRKSKPMRSEKKKLAEFWEHSQARSD